MTRTKTHRDMIGGIQTFNELVHFHPHIQAISSDGSPAADGTFLCLPKVHTDRLLATWQTKVFALLVAAGTIDQQTGGQMRSWPHSGFSVDNSVYPNVVKSICRTGLQARLSKYEIVLDLVSADLTKCEIFKQPQKEIYAL